MRRLRGTMGADTANVGVEHAGRMRHAQPPSSPGAAGDVGSSSARTGHTGSRGYTRTRTATGFPSWACSIVNGQYPRHQPTDCGRS
jgi:hypothetical protein